MTFKEKIKSGEEIQLEIIKKFSGEKRVYLGAELYEMTMQLIKDGIHNSRPEFKEQELKRKVIEIMAPWFKKKQ